jgi:hypothetical protein
MVNKCEGWSCETIVWDKCKIIDVMQKGETSLGK